MLEFENAVHHSHKPPIKMEFKNEELIDREIEIAGLLIRHVSLKQIAELTGLSKKLLTAHVKNMMQKIKASDMNGLIKLLEIKLKQLK